MLLLPGLGRKKYKTGWGRAGLMVVWVGMGEEWDRRGALEVGWDGGVVYRMELDG